MGLVMLVADYWPALAAQTAPDMSYSQSPLDSAGYLLGMLTTGLAEETIFRGLLVGMRVLQVPGRLRVGSLDRAVAPSLGGRGREPWRERVGHSGLNTGGA